MSQNEEENSYTTFICKFCKKKNTVSLSLDYKDPNKRVQPEDVAYQCDYCGKLNFITLYQ